MNVTIFGKIKLKSPRGLLFRKTVVKTQILQEVLTEEILVADLKVAIEDSEDFDRTIKDLNGRTRTKVHIRHNNSRMKFFSKIQFPFFSCNLLAFNLRIKTFKFKLLRFKTHSLRIQIFNRDHRLKSSLDPDPNYMSCTQQTQITCHKCGYPNHLATDCTVRRNPPRRGAQNPFNPNPKKLVRQHKDQKPKHVERVVEKAKHLTNFHTYHQKCVLFFL